MKMSAVWRNVLVLGIFVFWTPSAMAAPDLGKGLPLAVQTVIAEAGVLMGKGESEKAIQTLTRFQEKNPDSKYALLSFYTGNAFLQSKNPGKALIHYRAAAALAPDAADIWHNLALAAHETGNDQEAGRAMEKSYHCQSPRKTETLYHSGVFYLMAKDGKSAWPVLKKVIQLEKNPPPEWLQAYVQAAVEARQEKEAAGTLAQMLEADPGSIKCWEMITHLYLRSHDYKKAAAATEVLIQLRAPKPEDYRLLGDLYALVNLPLPSANAYAAARKTGDRNPALYVKEIQMLYAALQYDKALARIREGAQHGADPAIFQIAMQIHMAENRYAEAFEAGCQYEKSKRKMDSAFLFSLGYCAYKAGKPNQAIRYLKIIPATDKKHYQDASRLITCLNAEKAAHDES